MTDPLAQEEHEGAGAQAGATPQWWTWPRVDGAVWVVGRFQLTEPDDLTLALCALGVWAEPWLDGSRVSDDRLLPANAPPGHHVVERLAVPGVDRGAHLIGLWLGGGYNQDYSRWGWRWTAPPLFSLKIHGGRQGHVQVSGWRWRTSPIRSASLYAGERFDARLDHAREGEWCRPGSESAGEPLLAAAPPDSVQVERRTPPIRVIRSIPATVVTSTSDRTVFDLGSNMAGHVKLTLSGSTGDTITVRHAEELWADGSLDTRTNRNASATDEVTLSGRGVETYEPRFTHHGFRYVEVRSGSARVLKVVGREVRCDLESLAEFECSDATVNAIWANNRRALLANAMSFPTDTPVRDERTPAPLDVLATHDALLTEFDGEGFYLDYLRGASRWEHLPDMGGAAIALPWALFMTTGKREILGDHLPLMRAWASATTDRLDGGTWPAGEEMGFGDWASPSSPADAGYGEGGPHAGGYGESFSEVSLVNHALLAHQLDLLRRTAMVLGERPLAAWARREWHVLRGAFDQAFWTGCRYASGRQVTSILPLVFGLARRRRQELVRRALCARVEQDDGHLDTGIFGTRYLLDALALAGRNDLGLTVLQQRTYPGFGYQLARGATTPWEQWCYTGTMCTHNHAMFAGINASFYGIWGGVKPARPGWKRLSLDPHVPPGLAMLVIRRETAWGTLRVRWEKTASGWRGDLDLPVPATFRGAPLGRGRHRLRMTS